MKKKTAIALVASILGCALLISAFFLGRLSDKSDREKYFKAFPYESNEELSSETPWMEEREPIICLWKTNVPRGQYFNTNANLNSEVLTYSDENLYNYVKMMKYCGFTGIQVTDMCSAWAQYGNYEFVHDRLRFMADAAHSLDMKFTLWVWGAEFTGYGWNDTSVEYHDYENYTYPYEDPKAVETFEKYYDIYAELADCSDRVIMHFDDPSNIHDTESVTFFAKMFRDKVRAINPKINFGVSDYTNKYDLEYIYNYLEGDVTFYSGAQTNVDYNTQGFRTQLAGKESGYGIWSWNLCENEIDQMAWMNVNPKLIKSVYQWTREFDGIVKPTYWSEMDSYHVANLFSLYCAGHLLVNPELNPDDLLLQVSRDVVGDAYAKDLFEILDIIQDARCGESWETFKWGRSNWLPTSVDYPTEEILSRCADSLPILDEMIENAPLESKVPLPVSVKELLEMIRPHLKQIYEFAEFRHNLELLKADCSLGLSVENVEKKVNEIYKPIPNYDVLVGVWGQPEAIAQYTLLEQFCDEVGIEAPKDPIITYYRKQYIYEEMIAYQKESATVKEFNDRGGILWGPVIGDKAAKEIVDLLIEDGVVVRNANGGVSLADAEDYIYTYWRK